MGEKIINSGIIVPQDEGTGADDADYVSAGHIGGMHAHPNHSDYVASGMGVTFDDTDLELTVERGRCYIGTSSEVRVQNHEGQYTNTWRDMVYTVQLGEAETISADDDDRTQYCYVVIDVAENNGCRLVTRSGTNHERPNGPHLRIAEVDSDGIVTQTNRNPNGTYESLKVTEPSKDPNSVVRRSDVSSVGGSGGSTFPHYIPENETVAISDNFTMIALRSDGIEIDGTLHVGENSRLRFLGI